MGIWNKIYNKDFCIKVGDIFSYPEADDGNPVTLIVKGIRKSRVRDTIRFLQVDIYDDENLYDIVMLHKEKKKMIESSAWSMFQNLHRKTNGNI